MLISDQQGQGSRVRNPAFKVNIHNQNLSGDIQLTGVVDIEVTSTAHFSADTFRMEVAASALPPNLGMNYWDASEGDEVEIFTGFGADPQQSLIYGQIDDVEYEPVKRMLLLSGRDLTARLLDKRLTLSFTDHVASDIVIKIAKDNGLTPSVVPTPTRSGTQVEIMHNIMTQKLSVWDMLVKLAQFENYYVWVSGHTLNFQPQVSSSADPYLLQWQDFGPGKRQGNFEDLKLRRSENLAGDIVVRVESWNQAQGKTFTATARRSHNGAPSSVRTQTYSFFPPNLSQLQANQYANSMADQISGHERILDAFLPGDNLLTTRVPIKLTGTQTAWDQLYYPDTVTRKLSMQHGYTMGVRAKNHSALISSSQ